MDELANGCNPVQMQEKKGNNLKSRLQFLCEFKNYFKAKDTQK